MHGVRGQVVAMHGDQATPTPVVSSVGRCCHTRRIDAVLNQLLLIVSELNQETCRIVIAIVHIGLLAKWLQANNSPLLFKIATY